MDKFVLSKADVSFLRDLKRWFGLNKNKISNMIRRNPRLSGGGGGSSVLWAVVVSRPTYPNLTAPADSEELTGRHSYKLRIGNTSYNTWVSGSGYEKDDIICWPAGDVAYQAAVAIVAGSPASIIEPQNNPGEWGSLEEIVVEKALGYEGQVISLRDCGPWPKPGSEVIVIKHGDDYYFQAPSIFYMGEPEDATLRFDPSKNQINAVFR